MSKFVKAFRRSGMHLANRPVLSFRFHCYVCVSKRCPVQAVKVQKQKCVLQGFIGMASTSITLFYLMFLAGRQFCGRLLLKRSKIE